MLRRSTVPLVVAALGVALLAGCVTEPEPQETGFTGPNPPGDPTGQPAPTLTATPVGIPIDATCDELLSPQAVYDFNPNFGQIHPFTPAQGSVAASALAYQGLACRWQNQTSGDNIDVSVAQLDDSSLTALKNAAFEDSEMVPTYGEEAYFSLGANGVGTAIVFQGPYWIVVESPVFYEPGDAIPIVESVIAGLGA